MKKCYLECVQEALGILIAAEAEMRGELEEEESAPSASNNSDYAKCPQCGGGVIYTNDEQTQKSCCHCNHKWHIA